MSRFLIFANGEPNDGPMVQRALREAIGAHIVAADGGTQVAHYYGYTPQTLIGDMDSVPADELQRLQALGTTILRYPPEKDATDLELCLHFAIEQGATWICIIGAIGERFDQVMANVLLMALPILRECTCELVAGKQSIRLLTIGEHLLTGEIGDTLSLIPLAGDAQQVRTSGLHYPLHDETLIFGQARGVSNVFDGGQVKVSIGMGLLLSVHTVGRA